MVISTYIYSLLYYILLWIHWKLVISMTRIKYWACDLICTIWGVIIVRGFNMVFVKTFCLRTSFVFEWVLSSDEFLSSDVFWNMTCIWYNGLYIYCINGKYVHIYIVCYIMYCYDFIVIMSFWWRFWFVQYDVRLLYVILTLRLLKWDLSSDVILVQYDVRLLYVCGKSEPSLWPGESYDTVRALVCLPESCMRGNGWLSAHEYSSCFDIG